MEVEAVTDKRKYDPNRLVMQFHITGRCNLKCRHCYRTEGDVETLSFQDVVRVIEQYKALRLEYNKYLGIDARGHINLTGGEPMFRKDFPDILAYMKENREAFSYGILSNGSFIDENMMECLKRNNAAFVQLSLDGCRKTHDALRAEGDHDRVLRCARQLENAKIRTIISFTAHKGNLREIGRVAMECRRARVSKFWSDRLVPIGTGSDLKELFIDSEAMKKYVRKLRNASNHPIAKILYPKTEIPLNRALQFLPCDRPNYRCSAGRSLITVDEFGNIFPCRRMPIHCGNVFTETLTDVYFHNPVFAELQNEMIPEECMKCRHALQCRGGAKCQSFNMYSDYRRPDPSCPIIHADIKQVFELL